MHTTQNMEWIKLEEATIPNLYMDHMITYFVTRLADDGRPMNDYKDLSSHAFPLFKAGHIQSIFVSTDDDIYDIRCICLPEMKKDILYTVPSRKRAHGRCTLHWAKIGGWADIRGISIAFRHERAPR